MSSLVGRWEIESNKSYEEYMKALGFGLTARKVSALVKPTLTISQNDKAWKFKIESKLINSEKTAVEGVKFNEETIDGAKYQSVIRLDGPHKLVQEQRDLNSGEIKTIITREVKDDKLIQTLEANGVTTVITYKREIMSFKNLNYV